MLGNNANDNNVNDNNVEDNVNAINTKKNETDPMLILFYATWCGACNEMKPEWSKLEKKHPKEIVLGKVESEDYNNYKPSENESRIEGYPTIRLYHKGKLIKEYDGDRSFRSLYDFTEKFLKKNKSIKKNNLLIVRAKKGNKMNTELVKKIITNKKASRKRTVSQRKSPPKKAKKAKTEKRNKPKPQKKKKPKNRKRTISQSKLPKKKSTKKRKQ